MECRWRCLGVEQSPFLYYKLINIIFSDRHDSNAEEEEEEEATKEEESPLGQVPEEIDVTDSVFPQEAENQVIGNRGKSAVRHQESCRTMHKALAPNNHCRNHAKHCHTSRCLTEGLRRHCHTLHALCHAQ